MKVCLEGLIANVVSALPPRQRDYYGFCLEEVLGHIKDVVAGRHTIEAFAEHYCISASRSGTVTAPAEQAADGRREPDLSSA